MNIQQDVVWVTFEKEERHWEAVISDERIQGSMSAIAQALTEASWEIVAAIPSIWSGVIALDGQNSMSGLESMMVFVKRPAQ
jgi:hypothetical protein